MDDLRAFVAAWWGAVKEGLWAVIIGFMDWLSGLSTLAAALLVLAFVLLLVLSAFLLQRRLNHRLESSPDRRMGFLEQEVPFLAVAWLILPWLYLWRAARWCFGGLAGLVRRGRGEGGGENEGAESPRDAPVLAASLGPSFLLAGLFLVGGYLVAMVLEPALGTYLALRGEASAWQFLFLGRRPEMAAFLPMEQRPVMGAVLTSLLWLMVWWWLARAVRWWFWDDLGGNLVEELDRPPSQRALAAWRAYCGAGELWRPAEPYRQWATALLLAAVPLLIGAWFFLRLDETPIPPSSLSLAIVLFTSWSTHLALRGVVRRPEEPASPAPAKDGAEMAGWPEVLGDLQRRLQVREPLPEQPEGSIATSGPYASIRSEPLLSPLLEALLPEEAPGVNPLQLRELRRLSRLGHVALEPPPPPGRLDLAAEVEEERMGSPDERNRIVLAPEAAGKTTLALLAVANHALVHTRASLLVARDEVQAEALYDRLSRTVRRSGLRWTLRVRRMGDDLVQDLSEHIVPDVIIASLHQLTTQMLDQLERYSPFLRNLGLIVVDDAEDFIGPVETHAQLAFRRLALAARKLLGVAQLGEEMAPLILALATETSHRMPVWINALCGMDAQVGQYGEWGREPGGGDADGQRVVYRLRDFRTTTDEPLSLLELIDSCETVGARWHYRYCRDGARRLGRGSLPLPREPDHFTDSAAQAAVVILEGAWSEVCRELIRLSRPGGDHPRDPCSIVTLIDADEEMALTQRDDSLALARALERLPRPVLRPPSGPIIQAHMTPELIQGWTEVADVLRTFGNGSARLLRRLSAERLLLTEERMDVHPTAADYEAKVWVRALASAVADEDGPAPGASLAPKVTQVELPVGGVVEIQDRTDLSVLDRVEAASAAFLYYPGRIFANREGRFIVLHQAHRESSEEESPQTDTEPMDDPEGATPPLLADPTLSEDLSSPRYCERISVRTGLQRRSSIGMGEEQVFSGPDPLVLGDHALRIGLLPIRIRRRYLAALRLGPAQGEVRQQRLFGQQAQTMVMEADLETTGLFLLPNPPSTGDGARAREAPRLCLEPARLMAAAMRLVLPSLYRGAAESVGLCLHVAAFEEPGAPTSDPAVPVDPPPATVIGLGPGSEARDETYGGPAPEEDLGPVLEPEDGFVLYDLSAGGNGAARAVHRDGIELLLRLARLVIERVLDPTRMRALHDHWGTPDNPTGAYGPPRPETWTEERRRIYLERLRNYHRQVRRAALTWLDSRLQEEGVAAGSADSQDWPSHRESGEWGIIDLGRCWYTHTGAVADLLWTKHRWRADPVTEYSLDIGIDRGTAEEARYLHSDDAVYARAGRAYANFQEKRTEAEAGGELSGDHHLPQAVWGWPEDEDEEPALSQPQGVQDVLAVYQERATTLAIHGWPLVAHLASSMRDALGLGDDPTAAQAYARFVQGLETLRWQGLDHLGTPAQSLLQRRGDLDTKSLLLALLLRAGGFDSGLFVSPSEQRSLAALALPGASLGAMGEFTVFRDEEGRFTQAEDPKARQETYERRRTAQAEKQREQIQQWCDDQGFPSPPLWAEQPLAADASSVRLFVPVETVKYAALGAAWVQDPAAWYFIPLSIAWHKVDPRAGEVSRPAETGRVEGELTAEEDA